MAGLRGELVERTLLASECCHIGITRAPLQWAIGHLQGWALLGIFGKWSSVFPRTPGCRITVLNTPLQPQPDAINCAPCCSQQLDPCRAAVSGCCAISWLTQPQGCSDLSHSFSHRCNHRHQGQEFGGRYQARRLLWLRRFLWCEAGGSTVALSSLAPYLQWWTQSALSELPAVSGTWLGWTGCVWLMGSELEGGSGITLGNELDIFNASTEVWQLNTFCWSFSVPPIQLTLFQRSLCQTSPAIPQGLVFVIISKQSLQSYFSLIFTPNSLFLLTHFCLIISMLQTTYVGGQAVTILAHLPLIVTSSLSAFVAVGFRCLAFIWISLNRDNKLEGGGSCGDRKEWTLLSKGATSC